MSEVYRDLGVPESALIYMIKTVGMNCLTTSSLISKTFPMVEIPCESIWVDVWTMIQDVFPDGLLNRDFLSPLEGNGQ